MYYQDPLYLYQQHSPFHPNSMMNRNPPPRPSFLIDDILLSRQPFLLPKQGHPTSPHSHGRELSIPASSMNSPLSFGMRSILSPPRPREDSPVYQDPSPEVLQSLPVYFRVKPAMRTPSGRRCRKSRTVFTDLQLRVLEKTFAEQKYLDTSSRAKLAQTLGLNETQVKTWFQNRRMKWKKDQTSKEKAAESTEKDEELSEEETSQEIHHDDVAKCEDGETSDSTREQSERS